MKKIVQKASLFLVVIAATFTLYGFTAANDTDTNQSVLSQLQWKLGFGPQYIPAKIMEQHVNHYKEMASKNPYVDRTSQKS